jgi:hypothetical protein
MSLLCYIVKYLFYIRPILVVWRRTTSQTGAFATGWEVGRTGSELCPMTVCGANGVEILGCYKKVIWLVSHSLPSVNLFNDTTYIILHKMYDCELCGNGCGLF